jgi:hypothetical protein
VVPRISGNREFVMIIVDSRMIFLNSYSSEDTPPAVDENPNSREPEGGRSKI